MGMEGAVADVAQQVAVVLVGLPAVLAPLALLALPTAADDRRDADVGAGVVVVLAARRAEQQVFEFLGLQHGHVAKLPSGPVVVKVLGVINCEKK